MAPEISRRTPQPWFRGHWKPEAVGAVPGRIDEPENPRSLHLADLETKKRWALLPVITKPPKPHIISAFHTILTQWTLMVVCLSFLCWYVNAHLTPGLVTFYHSLHDLHGSPSVAAPETNCSSFLEKMTLENPKILSVFPIGYFEYPDCLWPSGKWGPLQITQ